MNVMLFQLFSGIWPHAILEKQLVESFTAKDLNMTLVSCGKSFSTLCPAQENYGLKILDDINLRMKTCEKCSWSSSILRKSGIFSENLILNSFITNDLRNEVEIIVSGIQLDQLTEESFHCRDDFRAGAYELIIRHKVRNFDLNHEQLEYFKNSVRNYNLVRKASALLLSKYKPDAVIIHSPQYAANSGFADSAKEKEIKVYFLGSNANLSEIYTSLRIYDWFEYRLLNPAPLNKSLADHKISNESLKRIENHKQTSEKADSIFVYSQPSRELSSRDVFGIPKSKKIYLLALSSYDEFFAGEKAGYMTNDFSISGVYKSQTDWVADTIEWASHQNDVVLIIRPHPREYPNRRENRTAPRDPKLQKILDNPPNFVRIDSPDLKFSIQDHFKEVDVMLISWSSTGIDALFQGIPVLAYDKKIARFPDEIVLNGSSRKDYLENLNKTLVLEKSDNYKIAARKWFDYSQHLGSALLPGRLVYKKVFKKNRVFTSIFYRIESKRWKMLWTLEARLLKGSKDGERVTEMLKNQKSSLYDN